MKLWTVPMLVLAGVLSPASGAATEAPDPAWDAAFEQAMARYDIPGLAVGIVRNGQVVYSRAGGVLQRGEDGQVTPQTLFKIASNSKAMTTAMLARLVDRGVLAWDDPVIKHLPGFRMHDDWVTRQMQVRDLLIHNSGLGAGAGDLMLWPEPNHFSRQDVVAGMAHLVPVYSFRSRYAYDNTLYIVAGEVAAAAAGAESFEALLRAEVFEPLRLDSCRVGEWRRDDVDSVAQPHIRVEGRHVPVREDGEVIAAVPMAAAGGVRCSLDDMLRWASAWLDPNTTVSGGGRWLSQERRHELWSAHTPMPLGRQLRDWEGARFYAYGYGWRLNDFHGAYKVSHTGTLSGMYSALTLFPELDSGFVVMMNGGGSGARSALVQALSMALVRPGSGPASVDHYADLQRRAAAGAAAARDSGRNPNASVEELERQVADMGHVRRWLGIYRDPWFGEVTICPADGTVRFVSAKSPMLAGVVMVSGGRLLVDWDDVSVDAEAWLDFSSGDEGGGAALAMAKVDPSADFSYDYEDLAFVRTGPCP